MKKPIAIQVPYELKEMLKYVKGKEAILEIGTARGGTLYEMMKVASPTAFFVSIDLPGADYGGEFGQPKEEEMQKWKKIGQKLYILRTDSTWAYTRQKVREILNYHFCRHFDFALIDGDHSFGGVSADYQNYGELCEVMAFHDIVEHMGKSYQGGKIEVKKFWDELNELDGEKTEIIADRNQGWGGIGILKIDCCDCCDCCERIKIHTDQMNNDIKRWIELHGFSVDKNNYVWIPQPCTKLVDGKCSIYEVRPKVCRNYICDKLKKFP